MTDTNSTTCRKCGESKLLTLFSIIKKTGKPNSYCKACRSKLAGEYAEANKEQKKQYNQEYRINNIERLREYDRERSKLPERRKALNDSIAKWAINNPEKRKIYNLRGDEKRRGKRGWYWIKNKVLMSARNMDWASKNPGKMKAYTAKWASKNPWKVKESSQLRRARKHGAVGRHTQSDILRIYELQRGHCACCRIKLTKYHVDHITALSRGGSNDRLNLQLLCPRCNLRKHAKHPIDFMRENGFLL